MRMAAPKVDVAEAANELARRIAGSDRVSFHKRQIAAQGQCPLRGDIYFQIRPKHLPIGRHRADRTRFAPASRCGLIDVSELKQVLWSSEILAVVFGRSAAICVLRNSTLLSVGVINR